MIALPVAIGFRQLSLFGVRQAMARKFAPLAAIALGLLLIAGAILAFNLWLGGREAAAVKRADAAREAVATVAREKAADARMTDALRNAANEQELHDAIDAAPPGGELSPAAGQ